MDHVTKGHTFKYASLKNSVNLHMTLAFTTFVNLTNVHFSYFQSYWWFPKHYQCSLTLLFWLEAKKKINFQNTKVLTDFKEEER